MKNLEHFNLDNNYKCPPMMSDGRLFTDYRPRSGIFYDDDTLENMSSYDYRQFLIKNSTSLIENDRKKIQKETKCNALKEDETTVAPQKNAFKCNKTTCKKVETNPNGIGTGRIYDTDDDLGKYYKVFMDEDSFNKQSR